MLVSLSLRDSRSQGQAEESVAASSAREGGPVAGVGVQDPYPPLQPPGQAEEAMGTQPAPRIQVEKRWQPGTFSGPSF